MGNVNEELEFLCDIADDENEPAPEWMESIRTWIGYIGAREAEQLLAYNVKPEIGKAGTNRPIVTGAVQPLIDAILAGRWKFTHQGIALDADGKFVDGQHRLEALIRADKVQPGIQIPVMITWNLPLDSNSALDLTRRRTAGTFLATDGYASAHRLSTILTLIWHFENADFDAKVDVPHWRRIIDADTARAILAEHPFAVDGARIGGQLQHLITPSAAGAAWTLCREKYPEEMNMEFVAGLKSGANLPEGDPRLAFLRWSAGRKEHGKKAIPFQQMAIYLKAFAAFRKGEPIVKGGLGFKVTTERFPRP